MRAGMCIGVHQFPSKLEFICQVNIVCRTKAKLVVP
jgi:hypothetical protein